MINYGIQFNIVGINLHVCRCARSPEHSGTRRAHMHNETVCRELWRHDMCVTSVYNAGGFIGNQIGRWVHKYRYALGYLVHSRNISLNGVITVW